MLCSIGVYREIVREFALNALKGGILKYFFQSDSLKRPEVEFWT